MMKCPKCGKDIFSWMGFPTCSDMSCSFNDEQMDYEMNKRLVAQDYPPKPGGNKAKRKNKIRF